MKPVAGKPQDLPHCRIENRQRLEIGIRQMRPIGTGVEKGAHQRYEQESLVRSRDADRDRLRLMLDRVDRPGELVDSPGESGAQILEDHRRADKAVRSSPIAIGRRRVLDDAQERGDLERGAGREVAVILAIPETREKLRAALRDRVPKTVQGIQYRLPLGVPDLCHLALDLGPNPAQRHRLPINRQQYG